MLFSIGPVQEFIAQARKTRDLWFGSHVLSEISKAAARQLVEVHKARMIFPYLNQEMLEQGVDNLIVANKVVAIVNTSNPKQVALDVRRAVTLKWLNYAKDAKEHLGTSIIGPMWDRQVKDFVEFYAVWCTLHHEDQYSETLKKAEQLMSARKTLRDFKPNEPADLLGDPKSSLDGGRESVLKLKKNGEYQRLGIKPSEYLDSISLVKRVSNRTLEEKRNFRSVCQVAFRQFTDALAQEQHQNLREQANSYIKEIVSKLKSMGMEQNKLNKFDLENAYDFFYPNRIEEAIIELMPAVRAYQMLEDNVHIQLTDTFTEKLNNLLANTSMRPTSYYALLVGDGDHMGDCLRNMKSIKQHQEFTRKLSDFASAVDTIVTEKCSGQMIYSGGDDLMAILPLHHCLKAARSIQQAFTSQMNAAVPEHIRRPTLSIGVTIVHMVEPLEQSLKLARAAEKLAKQKRNELAVHFQKRSGSEEMRVSLPFEPDPVKSIVQLQLLYKKGYISSSFAYDLRKLHTEYLQLEQVGSSIPDNELLPLLELEIRRLLLKKKTEGVPKEKVSGFVLRKIMTIFVGLSSAGESQQQPLSMLNRLAEQSILAITLKKVGETDGTYD